MAAILALDLGTQLGWATKAGGQIVSGSQSFKSGRYEGGGMRYLRFRQWLDRMNGLSDGIEMVVFEEVRRHASTDSAHVYGGLMGTLTAWGEENKIPYKGVPVGTIKKFWTGKGNAGKPEMIAEAKKRGFNPVDDNEADALALLHCSLEEKSC